MQCREFSEISEAYLSDELLVETNIQVLGHLEECLKCRERFTAARWLRQKLGSSIRNSREFQLDPLFAKRLSAELRETARHKPLMSKLVRPQISIPIFASVVIAALLGFMFMGPSIKRISTLPSTQPVVEGVAHLFAEVVMHHRTCAVEKLKIWEQAARSDAAGEATHRERILKPLRGNFSSRIKLLHSDDCLFEGKPFVHVILKDGENVVSVFVAKPAVTAGDATYVADSILLNEHRDGSWIATFRTGSQQVFVVSDFSEGDNLNIARTLFNAWM